LLALTGGSSGLYFAPPCGSAAAGFVGEWLGASRPVAFASKNQSLKVLTDLESCLY